MPKGNITKKVMKRGRRSRRGRPSRKIKELMESKDISLTEARKLAEKESSSKKKPVKKKVTKKRKPVDKFAIPKGLTKAEEREYTKLIKQSMKDKKESEYGQDYKSPSRVGETQEERLSINAPARSKELPPLREEMSIEQLNRMVTSGLAGIGKKGEVTNKGTYASGADVGQRMMRGDDGNVDTKALEDELRSLGGFEGLFKGGKVSKGKNKRIGRGCGIAQRGAGAVRKS